MLVEDGILLRKYWFSVSDQEQEARFKSRLTDPMRRWKLSPMDFESITRWEDYSRAKDAMFVHTDVEPAPWYVVESDDKRRARINTISHLLSTIPFTRSSRWNWNCPHVRRPAATSARRATLSATCQTTPATSSGTAWTRLRPTQPNRPAVPQPPPDQARPPANLAAVRGYCL